MSERKYIVRSVVDHDFEKEPKIEGKIAEFGKLPKEQKERRFAIIETAGSKRRVYESKALEDMFDKGKPGHFVSIELRKVKPLSGGRTFKVFDVQVWSE